MNKFELEQFIFELQEISGGLYTLQRTLENETEDIYANAAGGSWKHLDRVITDMRGKLEAWK